MFRHTCTRTRYTCWHHHQPSTLSDVTVLPEDSWLTDRAGKHKSSYPLLATSRWTITIDLNAPQSFVDRSVASFEVICICKLCYGWEFRRHLFLTFYIYYIHKFTEIIIKSTVLQAMILSKIFSASNREHDDKPSLLAIIYIVRPSGCLMLQQNCLAS